MDFNTPTVVIIVTQLGTLILVLVGVIWRSGESQVSELKATLNQEVSKIESWKTASITSQAELKVSQFNLSNQLRDLQDSMRALMTAVNQIPVLAQRVENLERAIRGNGGRT